MSKKYVILLADDDDSYGETFRDAFSAEFDVVLVHEASGIIPRMKSTRIDLVIIDIGMPGQSGLESISKIRAAGMTMPIIAISGDPDYRIAVAAMKRGAADFLSKGDARLPKLTAVIRDALRK